jgi:hypothetical protein
MHDLSRYQLDQGDGELRPFSSVSLSAGPVCGLAFTEASSSSKWNLMTLTHSGSADASTPAVLSVWEVKDGVLPRKKQTIEVAFPPFKGGRSNTAAGGARLAVDTPGGSFVIISNGCVTSCMRLPCSDWRVLYSSSLLL